MTAAIPVHVALVDDTHSIAADVLAQVAGALNEQVQADVAPVWKVAATVGVYAAAPPATWAIHLLERLDQPGALGYHSDTHRQPFAKVDVSGGSGRGVVADWPVAVSHELLEMLVDPFGSRMHTAAAPDGFDAVPGRVQYLLEVCDPCEATSYQAGGVAVSDFLLPAYYRTSPLAGGAYSHAGGVTAPRQIAAGGYVSFATSTGEWFQGFADDAGAVTYKSLGTFDGSTASLREWTDAHAREHRAAQGR